MSRQLSCNGLLLREVLYSPAKHTHPAFLKLNTDLQDSSMLRVLDDQS